MAKRISITRELYEEIAALYDDAVMSAEGGMGGRHALLVMALNALGIRVMSWQEAESKAREIIDQGWTE